MISPIELQVSRLVGVRPNIQERPKLPPYGKQVKSILQNQDALQHYSGCTRTCGTVRIATGPGAWEWQKARPNHLTVVLPSDENPMNFRWDFLRGHEPILLIGEDAENTDRRRQIAAALFSDGVQKVLAGRVLMERRL